MQIAIIGLGYVGLPLAVAFGKKYEVWGFDINPHRINELESGYDRTHEVSNETLQQAQFLQFTIARISQRLYFILIGKHITEPDNIRYTTKMFPQYQWLEYCLSNIIKRECCCIQMPVWYLVLDIHIY